VTKKTVQAEPPSPDDVFANALSATRNLTHSGSDLTHSGSDLTHSEHNLTDSHHGRDGNGRFIHELLDKPFIDNLEVF